MNRIKKLNEYQVLQSVSLAYLSVPTIIFIVGWLQPVFAIPLTLAIVWGVYLSMKAGWDFVFIVPQQEKIIPTGNKNKKASKAAKEKEEKEKSESGFTKFINQPVVFYSLTLLLVIIAVLYSGVGGFAIQDGDYLKHNGFFLDLTNYTWPLAYEKTGADDAPRMLNTYLAYYLPSALVGKIFGFGVAYFFSFIWVCLGLFLTLLWISQFVSKRSIAYLIMFILFGELAYFGWVKYFPLESMYGKSYNYANWMVFHSFQSPILKGVFWILGSNHTFLANGPHHIFPSWICILMVFHDAVFRKTVDRIGFVFAFVPFVSAFMAIGLAPFVLLAVIQNKFKQAFSIQNLLIAPLLLVVAALFLGSNNAQFVKGWVWEFVDMHEAWPYLLRFFIFSFGLYFLVMPKKASHFHDKGVLWWLYASIGCIVVFSFYRIGLYMDFPIKAYNPSWIIFQVCVIMSISYSKTFVEKIRSAFVILFILIASVGAFSNFKYAKKNKLFRHDITEQNSTHINLIGPKDQSGALFSDGKSFFWEVLAKKPIFVKN
jgi:hypothetical protein